MSTGIKWWPQTRQFAVLEAAGLEHPFIGRDHPNPPVARLIGVGGAAGGGKSDVLLAAGILTALSYPRSQVGYFRRTFPQLSGPGGAIMRSLELLSGVATYTSNNHRWTFPNGSILQFCHCQREADVHDYQSQQFDLLLFDEATHFTEWQVRYLLTRNRATVQGLVPLALFGTNPGGVGHLWFRDWFVDAGPDNHVVEWHTQTGKIETHLFLPARLSDNKILERRDPGYRETLEAQPEETRRALLEGDWDVFAGQVFKEWRRQLHVVEPFLIPDDWIRWRGVDWGYAAPFACLWLAMDPDSRQMVVYRELYESGLTDPEQATEIVRVTGEEENIRATLADPSMWTKKTLEHRTLTSAKVYKKYGVPLTKAENDRLTGKRRVHQALSYVDKDGQPLFPDGAPGLRIFSTCANLVRTLPALPYDETKVEDVDTSAEDHAYDALRYALSYKIAQRREPEQQGTGRRRRGRAQLDRAVEIAALEELMDKTNYEPVV